MKINSPFFFLKIGYNFKMAKIKVKSFTSYNSDDLERKINHWLEEEKEIEIIEVSQSQNSDGDIVIFIFYKTKANI